MDSKQRLLYNFFNMTKPLDGKTLMMSNFKFKQLCLWHRKATIDRWIQDICMHSKKKGKPTVLKLSQRLHAAN